MIASSLIAGDGVASRCSSRFDKVIRDTQWNHLNKFNQLLGILGLFPADLVQVYCQHANGLKIQLL